MLKRRELLIIVMLLPGVLQSDVIIDGNFNLMCYLSKNSKSECDYSEEKKEDKMHVVETSETYPIVIVQGDKRFRNSTWTEWGSPYRELMSRNMKRKAQND